MSWKCLYYRWGLPMNLFIYKINFISYGKFCISKVFTFWFFVSNLNHHQIGGKLRIFWENLQKLCCFLFKKVKFVAKLNHRAFDGKVCWPTWPSNTLWWSLARNMNIELDFYEEEKNINVVNFPQLSTNLMMI